ncbi:7-cyano-7-deazaguanine synthase QueC [Candidatus Gracilibacteria bacterium]|nr:7-cyano-7-deazaguanine synthase QueC [Candidatus Gracilibacteria bacterium]
MGKQKKGLILLSGGQDSTTCLAWALQNFEEIEAICFDYGQRHSIELECAAKIAKFTKIPLTTIKLDLFPKENALTNSEIAIEHTDKLPTTFVPGRNLVFLNAAAIHAYSKGITDIITGVCQTDYSGYPDCRDEFIKSAEQTLSLAMDRQFKIHTPLLWLTKAETVKMMSELNALQLYEFTHTCYNGTRPACGTCPSCELRLKGFKEAGIKDLITYK